MLADLVNGVPADAFALISTIGTLLLGAIGWSVKRYITSKRMQQALLLLASSAMVGARRAWAAYTASKKLANADGKLTDEEAAEARRLAREAALEFLTAEGKQLLTSAFKDGLDSALTQALENAYTEFRKSPDAAQPIADGSSGGAAADEKPASPVSPS